MTMAKESADDTEGESGCGRVSICHEVYLSYFLICLSRFVYGFRVIWNSNSGRV